MEEEPCCFRDNLYPRVTPHKVSSLIHTLPLHPPLLVPVPSLPLPLEMEHNSEQSVKMIPTTSACRRLEIYLTGWRSSRWAPWGGTVGVGGTGNVGAPSCQPGEL